MGLRDNAIGRVTAAQDAAASEEARVNELKNEAYADLLSDTFADTPILALGVLEEEVPFRIRRQFDDHVTTAKRTRYRVRVDDVVITGWVDYSRSYSSTPGHYEPHVETTCVRCGRTAYATVRSVYYREDETVEKWTIEIGKALKQETVCDFCRANVDQFCHACGKKQYDA